MTTSQSDVDKVMAAFGASPIKYRPNQDAAEQIADGVAAGGASSAPSARAEERILPGKGGRVREVFPLLWRAIPVVGDLKIGAIKRPGDEVPEPAEPNAMEKPAATPSMWTEPTPIDRAKTDFAGFEPIEHETIVSQTPPHEPSRVVPFLAAEIRQAAPVSAEEPARATAGARSARPLLAATRTAPWVRQVMGRAPESPEAPSAATAVTPIGVLPPLRSDAELIRPTPASQAPNPAMMPPAAGSPPNWPQPASPQPASPQPAAPQPAASWPGYPPPYPPPVAGYPPYYPPGYPPPPYPYPYGFPQPPAPPLPPEAYQTGYPPSFPPGFPPGYPPGYAPPGYGLPGYGPAQEQPPLMPPAPVTAALAPEPPAPPAAPPAAPAQAEAARPAAPAATLSEIFAALHRPPGADHGGDEPV